MTEIHEIEMSQVSSDHLAGSTDENTGDSTVLNNSSSSGSSVAYISQDEESVLISRSSKRGPRMLRSKDNLEKDRNNKYHVLLSTLINLITFVLMIAVYTAGAVQYKADNGKQIKNRKYVITKFDLNNYAYTILFLSFTALSLLRMFIKLKWPNEGNKPKSMNSRVMKMRYMIKTLCKFKSILVAFLVGFQQSQKVTIIASCLIIIDNWIESWNKDSTLNSCCVMAMVGSWYPEFIFQLSNPKYYKEVSGRFSDREDNVTMAMCYITVSMSAIALESSNGFFTGIVFLLLWAVTGESEILEKAFEGEDQGQSFNIILLWHATAAYTASCMLAGKASAAKFMLKCMINLVKRQKFCCPITRGKLLTRTIYTKLDVGIRMDCLVSEFDDPDFQKKGDKRTVIGRGTSLDIIRQNNSQHYRSIHNMKGVNKADKFKVVINNLFECNVFSGLTKEQAEKLIVSLRHGYPIVNELMSAGPFYFGHCKRLKEIVGDLQAYELRALDKQCMVGAWKFDVGDRYYCPSSSRDQSGKIFWKLMMLCYELMGNPFPDLCVSVLVGFNEKEVRKLIGNKKSKIFYNAYKTMLGVNTSFQLPQRVTDILNYINREKIEVNRSKFSGSGLKVYKDEVEITPGDTFELVVEEYAEKQEFTTGPKHKDEADELPSFFEEETESQSKTVKIEADIKISYLKSRKLSDEEASHYESYFAEKSKAYGGFVTEMIRSKHHPNELSSILDEIDKLDKGLGISAHNSLLSNIGPVRLLSCFKEMIGATNLSDEDKTYLTILILDHCKTEARSVPDYDFKLNRERNKFIVDPSNKKAIKAYVKMLGDYNPNFITKLMNDLASNWMKEAASLASQTYLTDCFFKNNLDAIYDELTSNKKPEAKVNHVGRGPIIKDMDKVEVKLDRIKAIIIDKKGKRVNPEKGKNKKEGGSGKKVRITNAGPFKKFLKKKQEQVNNLLSFFGNKNALPETKVSKRRFYIVPKLNKNERFRLSDVKAKCLKGPYKTFKKVLGSVRKERTEEERKTKDRGKGVTEGKAEGTKGGGTDKIKQKRQRNAFEFIKFGFECSILGQLLSISTISKLKIH